MKAPSWLRNRRSADRPPAAFMNAALWPQAVRVGKTEATSLALLVFMAGFTLDDLHVFRAPMAYVGALATVGVFAFLPPLSARRVLLRVAADAPPSQEIALDAVLARRRALLGLTLVGLAFWLILFSAGRTPRW